ncbi:MAG: hypothetical protein K0S46_639 [Moraxellaceae bacterium]|jgi:MSHA pilin protein MshC|nr:hypothetical protein [Moraxellaceae bacterium]
MRQCSAPVRSGLLATGAAAARVPNTPRLSQESRGFTLIELVVVIMLIAVVTALAGPRFLSTESFHRASFFHDVLSASRYAHQLAVATGCHVQLQLNAVNGYSLRRDANCAAMPALAPDFNAAGSQVEVPGSPGLAYASGSMPAGMTLTLTESSGALAGDTLIFSPDGTVRASPAGGSVLAEVTVTIGNDGSTRSFAFSGRTGYVR